MDSRPGSLEDASRLDVLRRSGLLDSPAEEAFDRLTRLAAKLLGAPVSLVSLVDKDRQFFKSAHGLAEPWASRRQTPLSHSFCQYVVTDAGPLVVGDATQHPFLKDNGAVLDLGVVAYLGMPLTMQSGETLGAFCVVDSTPREWTPEEIDTLHDLCASVVAEIELRIQLDELGRLKAESERWFTISPDLLAVTDPTNGRILRSNKSWQAILGWTPEDLATMSVWDIIHPDDANPTRGRLDTFLAGESRRGDAPITNRVRGKDGRFRWMAWTGASTADGLVVSSGRDVTAFKASEERFRDVFNSLHDVYFCNDIAGIVTLVSPSCEVETGYTPAEMLGQPTSMVFVNREAYVGLVSALYTNGAVSDYEVLLRRKDGQEVPTSVNATMLYDDAGAPAGTQGTLRDITERRKTEDALRASEHHYQLILDKAGEGIWLGDLERRTVYANAAALAMIGYDSLDEIMGLPLEHFTAPGIQDRPREEQPWRKGATFQMESRLIHKDGSFVDILSTTGAYRDADGNIEGIIAMFTDITERKHIEDAIHASEARYRNLMETAAEGVWMVDAEGHTTFANSTLARMFGTTVEEIVARPPSDFMDPEYRDKLAETRSLRRAGEAHQMEFKYRRADGSDLWTWISTAPIFESDGAYSGVLIMVTDSTERKAAEEERDRIFTSSIDMIAVMTAKGRFIRVNPAWQQALGYTSGQLVGQSLWHFAHPEDRAEGIARTRVVSEGEDVQEVRIRMRDMSGDYRWFSWNVGAASADGRCYAVARDVTEQVDAETQQAELVAVLEMHAMSLAEQTHEMDRLRLEAEFIANHDGLTGCLNRRAWFEGATNGRPTAVAIYDIDYFKKINDTYGHPIGDHVLKEVAWRLQSIFNGEATLGRIGGEEFAVLFEGSVEDAVVIGREVVEVIATTPIVLPDGTELTVTISAGLAPWIKGKHSREESLALTYEAADKALYGAKEGGRRRLCVFSEEAESRAA